MEHTIKGEDMAGVRGSCLCGGVKFEITGPLSKPLNCHCVQCRKQHGAAFRSRVRVRVQDFKWLQGEDQVKYYESSPGFRRGFCRNCGSPVVNRVGSNYRLLANNPGAINELGVPLGILDNDPGVHPAEHVFVSEKAPWFKITDDLPRHQGVPVGT
jgi:hypothetical protein